MHEISIAESILDIVQEKAREQNACSVQVIKVRLGEFTTIVREALEFAFEVVRQGTLAENACLEIEFITMVLHCVVCDATTQPEFGIRLVCARCGFPLKIVAGEELQIEYIEIETEKERTQWMESQNELQNAFQCRPTS
jgi:hydrogenase nickel incorporation protein HypA/HybF